MRKGSLVFGMVLLVSMLGLAACGGGEEPTPTTPPPTPTTASDTGASDGNGGGEAVEVQLTETPYTFIPDSFNFETGKTYALEFNAPGEFHTFTVDALGIDIFINAGESVTEDVTFDQTGTFELICTPHIALGMTGEITVS